MREKIRTFSGIHMSPADPRPEEICIEDIAHALSLMTRANGHFPVFYSVAQHSLDCAAMAQAEGRSSREVLACLLHDASEAYLSDITRPVKGCLPEYCRIEQVLQEMIYEKSDCAADGAGREIVKRMDDTRLYYEFEHFTGEKLFDGTAGGGAAETGAGCGKWKSSRHCLRN
ncbi:MAG: phosphohydrolase [Roseburia hominis]